MVKRQKMSVNKIVDAAKSTSAEYSCANIAAAPPVGIPKRTAKISDVICPHLNTKNAIIYIIIGIIISLDKYLSRFFKYTYINSTYLAANNKHSYG